MGSQLQGARVAVGTSVARVGWAEPAPYPCLTSVQVRHNTENDWVVAAGMQVDALGMVAVLSA